MYHPKTPQPLLYDMLNEPTKSYDELALPISNLRLTGHSS